MNILTDTLPEFVTVGSVKYGVRTDFRIWMEFARIMHEQNLCAKDKIMMILKLCIDGEKSKVFPDDAMEIIDALCKFYTCGKENKSRGSEKTECALDFSLDSGYIYSAFLTQYGIDLLSIPYMHWYAFCALFDGLEGEREIIKIMRFRVCKPEREKNAEKRNYLKRMRDFYSLSGIKSKEEREQEIADILFEAFC